MDSESLDDPQEFQSIENLLSVVASKIGAEVNKTLDSKKWKEQLDNDLCLSITQLRDLVDDVPQWVNYPLPVGVKTEIKKLIGTKTKDEKLAAMEKMGLVLYGAYSYHQMMETRHPSIPSFDCDQFNKIFGDSVVGSSRQGPCVASKLGVPRVKLVGVGHESPINEPVVLNASNRPMRTRRLATSQQFHVLPISGVQSGPSVLPTPSNVGATSKDEYGYFKIDLLELLSPPNAKGYYIKVDYGWTRHPEKEESIQIVSEVIPTGSTGTPISFNQSFKIGPVRKSTNIMFRLFCIHKTKKGSKAGETRITVGHLLERPFISLFFEHATNYSCVTDSKAMEPTRLNVTVDASLLPDSWPPPKKSTADPSQYPKHVMILTRGTREAVVSTQSTGGWL
eukprot:TRINITY_DN9495_c0_g1_i2.p1 TRINITY_DN9495_c0_g1~~TRINITY_DN9495_c0_g1_i2.p1  ORF type:complete len:410 (+),score=92.34 TRINITY_DN9495_c0_g1_i2:49-1230(+)